ncbi:MAG: polyprenyl synthetase family protein [Candidatus Micrarchaeales archaeon]
MMGSKPPKKQQNMELMGYLNEKIPLIDGYLKKALTSDLMDKLLEREGFKHDAEALKKGIKEPLLYLYELGGKRIRAALTMLIIDTIDGDSNNFTEFSAIPEAIHNATLIQDDIEDDSVSRRGKPAVHIKFGIDRALNASTAAYYLPVAFLKNSPKISREQKYKIREEYEMDMLKLALGQAIDIELGKGSINYKMKRTEGNYMEIIAYKTGTLMGLAAKIGGIVAGADERTIKALEDFGMNLGLAFQIHDDVLNLMPSDVAKNKGGVGEDITDGKLTLPMLKAMQPASDSDKKRFFEILGMKTAEMELITEAIDLINKYDGLKKAQAVAIEKGKAAADIIDKMLPESESTERLKDMVAFALSRTN